MVEKSRIEKRSFLPKTDLRKPEYASEVNKTCAPSYNEIKA